MSKSYANYIGVADPPEEQYGKAMSIPDALIVRWLTLATDVPASEVEEIARGLAAEEVNPRDAKARLARAIVTQFHGPAAAKAAEAAFRRVHAGGGLPDEVPEVAMRTGEETRDAVAFVADALRAVGEVRSGNDIRRNLAQGGVSLHDQNAGIRHQLTDPKTPIRFAADGSSSEPRVVVEDGRITVRPGAVVQFGKRVFIRCVAG
jgi:tyrosyl-tRNA synthetase